MNKARVLVVDDERAIADMVQIILHKEGIDHVDVCYSFQEAEKKINTEIYSMYILDMMLPDGTGEALSVKVRRRSDAPLFFLTAKTSDADKLVGFMHGADDYITKPFNPLELAARVKVNLKRYLAREKSPQIYHFGHGSLDVESAELIISGKRIALTEKQFHLLHLFCKHPNQVISKEQIYEYVWGYGDFINDNTIMVHISKLREKVEPFPEEPIVITTVRGLGYRFNVAGDRK